MLPTAVPTYSHLPDGATFDAAIAALLYSLVDAGNALTVAVLRLDTDKTNSTTWLLQALAAVDTAYLATCLVIQPLKIAHELYGVLSRSFPVIERYVWPLAATAKTTTVCIVLLVTGDRYVAVCRPFQARWRSVERTRLAVIVVVVLAVLYNLPQWFEREVVWKIDECTGLPTEIALIKKVSFDVCHFWVLHSRFVSTSSRPLLM